jgi:hypothetical protein
MTAFLTPVSFQARKLLAQQGLAVKHQLVLETLASLLGYKSFAALKVEEDLPGQDYYLDDAEVLVVNQPEGLARALSLGLPGDQVVSACIDALKALCPTPVYVGVQDFYEMHAQQALIDAVYDSDDVAGAMADTGASYEDDPDMDGEWQAADLWRSQQTWSIEDGGVLSGDPVGDRIFAGDTLLCHGFLTYAKAGRAGLVLIETTGGASVDNSWRDYDDRL